MLHHVRCLEEVKIKNFSFKVSIADRGSASATIIASSCTMFEGGENKVAPVTQGPATGRADAIELLGRTGACILGVAGPKAVGAASCRLRSRLLATI